MRKLTVSMIWIFLLLIFSNNGFSQEGSTRKEIKNARWASNEAIKNHDLDGISDFWDEEIVITTGSGVVLRSEDEILKVLERSFAGNKDLYYIRKPRQIKLNPAGDMAWETGRWKSYGTETRYEGRYTAMWARVGEEWKIRSQIFVGL